MVLTKYAVMVLTSISVLLLLFWFQTKNIYILWKKKEIINMFQGNTELWALTLSNSKYLLFPHSFWESNVLKSKELRKKLQGNALRFGSTKRMDVCTFAFSPFGRHFCSPYNWSWGGKTEREPKKKKVSESRRLFWSRVSRQGDFSFACVVVSSVNTLCTCAPNRH